MPDWNEATTRTRLIDPALERAGWDLHDPGQAGFEIPVDGTPPEAWQEQRKLLQAIARDGGIPYSADPLPAGICDYALYRANGEVLAIVEAKRTCIDPRFAQPQAAFYVREVARRQSFAPFAFMTNGHRTYFWEPGLAVKREVPGFFSRADLENLLYLRQHARPLHEVRLRAEIADRPYQVEAIRRLCEAFERDHKRRALLVMATGTGKTRTAMSLIDVFLRANQARKVLFVADRDALVQQALDDGFKVHLPTEPCDRIYGTQAFDPDKRLYVVTLQTLNNLYKEFTPGAFDLIVYDEVHRSIFNRWREPLEYFDARTIGLTATPAEYIDRNTFLAFGCAGSAPTYLYPYEQAVRDGYLVDFVHYQAQTGFQRTGIHGADLDEEQRNALVEQGIDPDALDYSGSELETRVSNAGTLRAQWDEFWRVCRRDAAGLPGKTIVFALTQAHAQRLQDVFEEMYPQYPGLARVITYQTQYARGEVTRFKHEDWPRIAISVDMLETGVDVPECVNLVFMRPVQSPIKLAQMVGRGTRCHAACRYPERLPGGHKDDFLILDFWQNDFNKDPSEAVAQSLPVLVALFYTRLKLLERLLAGPDGDEANLEERATLISDLRAQIGRIPTDTFAVRQAWPEIERAWEDGFWRYLTPADLEFLRNRVGPLLRYAPGVDVAAETFAHKVERFRLQRAQGAETAATLAAIAADVRRLPDSLLRGARGARQRAARDRCLALRELREASAEELREIVAQLAGLMSRRPPPPDTLLEIDLADEIALRGYVLLQGWKEPVYAEEYRRRVEERVRELAETHPTVRAISRGEPVSDEQLVDLERTLRRELGRSELHLTPANLRAAYRGALAKGAFGETQHEPGSLLEFLRQVLDLDGVPGYAEIVRRQFAAYILAHARSADQAHFLRVVQSVFLQKRRLRLPDLYEAPLDQFGRDAADRLFAPDEIEGLLAFAEGLAVE